MASVQEIKSFLSRKLRYKKSSKSVVEGLSPEYFADCSFQQFSKECLDTSQTQELIQVVARLRNLQAQAKDALVALITQHKQEFLKIAVGTKQLASTSESLSNLLREMLQANQQQIREAQDSLVYLAELRKSKDRIQLQKKALHLQRAASLLKLKIQSRLQQWKKCPQPIILPVLAEYVQTYRRLQACKPVLPKDIHIAYQEILEEIEELAQEYNLILKQYLQKQVTQTEPHSALQVILKSALHSALPILTSSLSAALLQGENPLLAVKPLVERLSFLFSGSPQELDKVLAAVLRKVFEEQKALTSLVRLQSFRENFEQFQKLRSETGELPRSQQILSEIEQRFDLKSYGILVEKVGNSITQLLGKKNQDNFQIYVKLNSKQFSPEYLAQLSSLLDECFQKFLIPSLKGEFLRIGYSLLVQGAESFKQFLKSRQKFGVIQVLVLLRYLDQFSTDLPLILQKHFPQQTRGAVIAMLKERTDLVFGPCADTLSGYILQKSLETLQGMQALPANIRIALKDPGSQMKEGVVSSYVGLSGVPMQQLREKALFGKLSEGARQEIEKRVRGNFVTRLKEVVRGMIVNEETLISSLQQLDSAKTNESILVLQRLKGQLEVDLTALGELWGGGVGEVIEFLHN